MRRTATQLRTSISKYVPKTIKSIKRAVFSGLHELNRAIRGNLHRNHARVLQISIPKSGTHLLNQLLEGAGYQLYRNQPFNPDSLVNYDPRAIRPHLAQLYPDEYFIEHLVWQDEMERILVEAGIKVLFIYRDPRATVLSWCHHMVTDGRIHPLHEYYRQLPSLRDRIIATLARLPDRHSGVEIGISPWAELYDQFLPWKHSKTVFSLSFEDLIGSRGGGSDETQLSTIERILKHLGHQNSSEIALRLARKLFNPSVSTFRKGMCDAWRSELDAGTQALLDETLRRQLVEWGYK